MPTCYLENPLSPGEHDFAIIDRMHHPDVDASWPVLELVSPMLKPQAHLYPWLLPLKEMDARGWQTLMERLTPSQHTPPISCLLLRSEQPVAEVRNLLIKALYFTDRNLQGHILRYYDPRVLFHLCWMLTPYQLTQALPVPEITRWTFWLEGRWQTLAPPAEFSWQPGTPRALPLEQLQRCGLINQVLEKLPCFSDMSRRQQVSRKIDTLLQQAEQLQLPTDDDRAAFALRGLTLRDAFWTAPKMAAFLRQARSSPGCFADETRLWDEKRWNEMTRDSSADYERRRGK
ncbi:DUF4123 domain-containing protein [Intestinirhabdus alba]|jgi:hypothetical protein|uniref:DUF4123 domain-containing protein n=1 Tax=Intestinirhabdus alba TaxID=2899544 RepID=A0A6L6IQ33_9ENTR|nr:DUF4123 domain-containing protein [Intestinirhabdus alba]MTH48951.1 DUF4123 domain-containing protein [Intestinirhabdus alba]